MKKLFFIAAIAGAALVSCTKNELAPSATEQHEITFASPVVGAQTKAFGAIGTNYDMSEKFDVWAIYNPGTITTWGVGVGGTEYIVDKTVSFTGTKNDDGTYLSGGWGFSPSYFWPANGYLSFVALSPSIGNTTTYDATNGFKIETWSQGTNESNIIDLMYSNESLNNAKIEFDEDDCEEIAGPNQPEDKNKYEGVDITFNHALSYLVFQIKTKGDYSGTTEFKLNTITLSHIYNTGSFTQKPTEDNPNWVVGGEANCTYVAYNSESGLPFGVKGAATTAVPVPETKTKEIILLPQTLTPDVKDADGNITSYGQTLTINYKIKTTDGSWIDQVQTANIVNGGITEWEMGKKYTYTITIGMTELIFDPAVSDWDTNDDEADIEL